MGPFGIGSNDDKASRSNIMVSLLPFPWSVLSFSKYFREKKWDDTVQATCACRVQPTVESPKFLGFASDRL